jgi:hypothetical protein
VQVTPPKFVISTNTSARTTQGPQAITVYAADANGNSHYTTENVTVTLTSSAGAVAGLDSTTVTIGAGQYYHNTSRWLPLQVGTSQLRAADARSALYKYDDAVANVAVTTPSLAYSFTTTSLGLGQYIDQAGACCHYVQTQDNMVSNTTVALTHVGTARVTAPATVTIPASSYYAYFRLDATSRGTDTLVATAAAPAHVADTAFVVVDTARIDNFSGWPAAAMAVGDSALVTLYTRDPNLTARPVISATTFAISAGANIEIRQSNAVVTSVTVPAGASSVQFYVKAKAAGSGSAAFSNALYRTYSPPSVTVNP